MIGPCWIIDREAGCQYWVGPHVITPALEDLGLGKWRDEEGEHYCPPDPAVPICKQPPPYIKASDPLSGPAVIRWLDGPLGQPPPVNWTGVPKPPYWDLLGLPWPPEGPLPAVAPPGWIGTWPPPPPPGWPAEWPFPLPPPPPPGPPPPPPPEKPAPSSGPEPKPVAKKDNTAIYVVGGIAIVGLVIAAVVLA